MKSYDHSLDTINHENVPTSDSENIENEEYDRADSGLTSDGTIQEDENQSNGHPEDYKPEDPNHGALSPGYTILVKIKSKGKKRNHGVVVTIERDPFAKPFLGGFRNKVTGSEYHNAAVQTNHALVQTSNRTKISREIQTTRCTGRGQQTTKEKSSQVTIGLNGLYVSCISDKVVEARRYVTTEELFAAFLRKVTTIQKGWRGYLARKKRKMDTRESSQVPTLRQLSQRIAKLSSNEDFEQFHNQVQRWRQEQLGLIFATKSGPQRLSALQGVIEQEALVLNKLNQRKMLQNREDSLSENAMRKVSPPNTWSGQSFKSLHRMTPAIMKIRKYRGIYHRLRITQAGNAVRLKVLHELREALEDHDSRLTDEIIALAQQESVLIARDTPTYSLGLLRQKILMLFLQFIFDPKSQTMSTSNLETRGKTAPHLRNVSYCSSCCHYRPAEDFVWSAGEKTMGLCWSCRRNCRFPAVDQESGVFKHLLKALRKSEEQLGCFRGPAFIIGEKDIRYLVQNIWHQQSVLSGVDDPYNLSLCRWKPEQPWSPWNCILLAEEEARAHHRLESPEDAYGPIFTQKVKHKHMIGRRYFHLFPKKPLLSKDQADPVSTSIYITVKPAALHSP